VSSVVEQAAARLRAAEADKVPCAPIRDLIGPGDLVGAYAVQEANVRLAEAQGRRVVGRKIGLTSRAVQMQLGVEQPDYGVLFADMAIADGEQVALGRVLQPKVEAEVAFVLEHDLPHAETIISDVIAAVAYALPAIEIVGSRIAGWDIGIVDTIADNASSGAFVLGTVPVRLDRVDLRLCGMAMFRGGEPVSVGAGAACLGHPLNAATWLARTMAAAGRPLKAGDILLSGALGPMVGVCPGDVVQARIEGLGAVTAAFAADVGEAGNA
jgi:2-keto-4-pentenoate hydratase